MESESVLKEVDLEDVAHVGMLCDGQRGKQELTNSLHEQRRVGLFL